MPDEEGHPTWPQVKVAFWRNYRALTAHAKPPNRDDPQDPDFWAWEYVDNLGESEGRAALVRLVDLADDTADAEELAYLGTGPVEDFVSAFGEELADEIEGAARRSPSFLRALRGMYPTLIPEAIRGRMLPLVPATVAENRVRTQKGLAPLLVDSDNAARNHWELHEYVQAARLIFDSIPPNRWPTWGAKVLIEAYAGPNVIAEIDELLDVSRDRSRWFEARRIFNALRKLTLQPKRVAGEGAEYELILKVAENVAKITYNASGGTAPYDYAAGYHVVECLGYLSELWGDPRRRANVWQAIDSRSSPAPDPNLPSF